jgi:hypothetical protein
MELTGKAGRFSKNAMLSCEVYGLQLMPGRYVAITLILLVILLVMRLRW